MSSAKSLGRGRTPRPIAQKLILALATTLIVGSLAICALIYAKYGGGGYNPQQFTLLILVAAVTTAWATERVVRGLLHKKLSLTGTFLTSVLSAASVLLLALFIHGRG